MAEDENGQERTEEPTEKRLRESRQKGQVPRSRELNTMMVTLAGAVAILLLGQSMVDEILALMRESFTISRSHVLDSSYILEIFKLGAWQAFKAVWPFMLVMLLVAIAAPTLIGGWSFSTEALSPKLERMDPIKGMKRIFSVKGLMELAKSIAKVTLIGGISYAILAANAEKMMVLGTMPLHQALAEAGWRFGLFFVVLSASLILVAAIDVPFQLWDHKKQMRMTRQEVRDEMKDTEGRPEVKQRVRQMQMEMSRRRMMEKVPGADVVITNPTHFACALKYDHEKGGAPVLVAKGADEIAFKIREIAKENQIDIFEEPPLARALYYNTELDQEIPAELYLAVAQVLAYLYQIKTARQRGGQPPSRPQPDVPDEMWKDKDGV